MSPGKAAVSARNGKPALETVRGAGLIHRARDLPFHFHESIPAGDARVPGPSSAADALAADALAADAVGEPMDPRDAEHIHDANLSVLQVARDMLTRIVRLLR